MRSSSRAICARALIVIRPVAIARADIGDLAQERRLRLARRHRIRPESGSRDRPSCTAAARRASPVPASASGRSANSARHRRRATSGSARRCGASRRPAAASVGVVVDAGEHVEQRPVARRRRSGRRWWRAIGTRNAARQRRRAPRCRASSSRAEVPLQLDVDVGRGRTGRPADRAGRRRRARGRRAAARPAERHQAAREPVELLERQRALAFRRAQLHARDQPAEIPIALLRSRTSTGSSQLERIGCGSRMRASSTVDVGSRSSARRR